MSALAGRPTEKRTLHYDFSHLDTNHDFTLHVCMEAFPLRVHDTASRAKARAHTPLLRHVPDHSLTHYIEDHPFPADAVALVQITRPVRIGEHAAEHTVHMAIHVPDAGRKAARALVRRKGAGRWRVHPKLRRFNLLAAQLEATEDPEFPAGIDGWQDAVEAAAAVLFHHPSLINLSTDNGGAIPAYILQACILTAIDLAPDLPATILSAGDGWMTTVRAVGPDQQPLSDSDGNPVFGRQFDPDVQLAITGALTTAIRLSRDDEFLKGQQWSVQYGVTTAPYDAQARDRKLVAHAAESHPSAHLLGAPQVGDGPFKWRLSNLSPGSGLSMDANVSYQPPTATGKWKATGSWSDQDPATTKLDQGSLTALLAGNVYVKVTTADHPQGVLRGQLVPAAPPKNNEAVTFTVTLTGDGVVPKVTTTATGSGTFVLNSVRTGLTYDVEASGLNESAAAVFGIGAAGAAGVDRRPVRLSDQSGYGRLSVNVTNEWLRHLSACVQFRTQQGGALAPEGWSDLIPSYLAVFQPDPSTKFVKLVPPVRTVFGIPLPADATTISFPVPDGAQSIRLRFGGLGQGRYDIAVCPIGIAVTVTCEMAIPIILLVAGTAVMNSGPVQKLMADSETLLAVCAATTFLVAGPTAAYIGLSQNPRRAAEDVALALSPLLLSASFALGRWLLQEYAKGLAAKAIPFVNVGQMVLSGAITAAQLTQTTCEVLSSPFVFEAEITRTIDLKVTLVPDHNFHRFPDQAVKYLVRVTYDKGATVPDQTFTLPGRPPWSDPIDVTFTGIPAGGNIKVYVFFYAGNGWQAGQGESNWLPARGTSGSTLTIDGLEVTTNIPPLTRLSVYTHQSQIAYDPAKGGYFWNPSDAPTATIKTEPPFRDKNKVVKALLGITTAQRPAQMAYAWEATGLNVPPDDPAKPAVNTPLYTLQNLSTLQHPGTKLAVPKVGFSVAAGVMYDLQSPEDGSGRNFFIDPTAGAFDPVNNPGGGLHVRRIPLTFTGAAPDFALRTNKSWGRFQVTADRYVLHPQGYIFAIDYATSKLQILKLADAESTDANAPFATDASGEGVRDGLMRGPQAIAAGMDGRLLILESVNQRIQAFDISGNPVPYFKDPNNPNQKMSTMPLVDPGDSFYLDLAVEAKGYLYVLRFRQDGSVASKYQVDIYEPDGTFLVTTTGVAAAKIAVDILRNMFTLNYQTILGPGGRPEPTVSLWIPPAPPV